jgi:hypothetical protein
MPNSGGVDRKLAEEFARELVAELRQEPRLELNLVNWAVLESLLVLRIEGMELKDALDHETLTQAVHETLESMLRGGRESELDEQLIKLLDSDLIELVVTQQGELGYRWKQ